MPSDDYHIASTFIIHVRCVHEIQVPNIVFIRFLLKHYVVWHHTLLKFRTLWVSLTTFNTNNIVIFNLVFTTFDYYNYISLWWVTIVTLVLYILYGLQHYIIYLRTYSKCYLFHWCKIYISYTPRFSAIVSPLIRSTDSFIQCFHRGHFSY